MIFQIGCLDKHNPQRKNFRPHNKVKPVAAGLSLVDAELSVYLQADVISQAEPPTEWWAANAARYPLLAAEAKRYLSDCKNRIGDRK